MVQVSLGWLIFKNDHSSLVLGIVGFAANAPSAIVAPFAGALADQIDSKLIILTVQILRTILAGLLAFVALDPPVNIVAVLFLVCSNGIVNGFDISVRQELVGRLVRRNEHLGGAVATSSILYDFARILGPYLGGTVVSLFSESFSFLGGSLLYLLAFVPLFAMQPDPSRRALEANRLAESKKNGLSFALKSQGVLSILQLSASFAFAGSAYMVLMPIIASVELNGGASTLGLLQAAVGVGAIAGGVTMSPRSVTHHFVTLVAIGGILFALGLFGLSFAHAPWFAMLTLALTGLGIMLIMSCCSTILLTIVDPAMRGRVMGLFSLSFLAFAPLGSLSAGFLASVTSVQQTIRVSAVICSIATALFYTKIASLKRSVSACIPTDTELAR